MPYDFQKEEDVKEFLENLGIEYRFECFKEKKPDGCHRLGDYLEAIKKDFARACNVYKNNCDDYKHGKSCFKYANYRLVGKGSAMDKVEAQRYYHLGCEAGYAKACFGVGLGLTSPDSGLEQDVSKGLAFFSKACDMGSADGCYFASSLYITGREELPRDMRRAFEFAVRACDLKNMQACSNVALMYARGHGVRKDASQAERYRAIVNDYNEQLKQNRGIEMEQGIKD
ncbi:cytochrome c oxidase assembly factor 7 homolog [Rhipicephalus sanguineus]|uniref:cytochrome c oxidase assembly factor 7 homolog n=1 Tax=Rhipicephalus sanguineus TaxID=34632 RepID=UPI001895D0AA|nr:cytochrome c oxidase assembly factor 7 homolog [Rhipicephalus sanguineus]XP_049275287.1 cytochrome c oxidase assembly factor 7 homolog [Rhipicephalus sanguineus]